MIRDSNDVNKVSIIISSSGMFSINSKLCNELIFIWDKNMFKKVWLNNVMFSILYNSNSVVVL